LRHLNRLLANEIDFNYPVSGLTTLYAVLRNGASVVHAGTEALMTRNSANWANAAGRHAAEGVYDVLSRNPLR
jgi:hypothetical protein